MVRTVIPGFIGDSAPDSTPILALTLARQVLVIDRKIPDEEKILPFRRFSMSLSQMTIRVLGTGESDEQL